ncbi:cation:proton antiporter [Halioxenophilus sp. WMMB6]|uniref:cation:proton antiporter n=1 Tax=Halioxenophilus sp. WMMB6 TaxID=3073815 RepID=UPI00295E225C|nr:cation:proton antiporter [Halioxenophilus sp. WMMB6]
MEHGPIFSLALVGVLGLASQWLAWWLRLPAILFLLLTGIVIGPGLGWLHPDQLFGELLFPLVSMAVAVILFEGSLTLKFNEIKGMESTVWRMLSLGLIASWVSISLFTSWLLELDWHLSLLFGALVVVTGPTVIVPMLRSVRPNSRITNILRWESILIDPLGALLVVLVFNFIVADANGGNEWLAVAVVFSKILVIGVALGCGAGYLCGQVLRRQLIPGYLQNVFALIAVFAVFALSDTLEHESGLLAVTIMGIWLANMAGVETENILDFKESLSILLISGLFILLAARIDLHDLITLGWQAIAVLAFIHFIARPIKIISSTFGTDLTWQEKTLISWIGPRGIIAAAVSALFALRLSQLGYANADLLVTLTFVVIIGTVVFQSLTAKPLAQLLGVVEQAPQGTLLIGANVVSRTIAQELQKNGFDVRLADSYRSNVRLGRMAGLRVFHGNPVSRLAEKELDLVGLGRMLGVSQNDELNLLAVQRYGREFGKKRVYALPSQASLRKGEREQVAEELAGLTLFSGDVTFAKLASLIAQGAEMRTTSISDEFTFEHYQQQYGSRAIPMFLMNGNKKLTVLQEKPTAEQVSSGTRIIALVQADNSAKERGSGEPNAKGNSNGKSGNKENGH